MCTQRCEIGYMLGRICTQKRENGYTLACLLCWLIIGIFVALFSVGINLSFQVSIEVQVLRLEIQVGLKK